MRDIWSENSSKMKMCIRMNQIDWMCKAIRCSISIEWASPHTHINVLYAWFVAKCDLNHCCMFIVYVELFGSFSVVCVFVLFFLLLTRCTFVVLHTISYTSNLSFYLCNFETELLLFLWSSLVASLSAYPVANNSNWTYIYMWIWIEHTPPSHHTKWLFKVGRLDLFTYKKRLRTICCSVLLLLIFSFFSFNSYPSIFVVFKSSFFSLTRSSNSTNNNKIKRKNAKCIGGKRQTRWYEM